MQEQKIFKIILFGLLLLLIFTANIHAQTPIYSYLGDEITAAKGNTIIEKPYRVLEIGDRKGVNIQSIHSAIAFPKHTLNEPKGTFSIWINPMEDLYSYPIYGDMDLNNPNQRHYPILSANSSPQAINEAGFKIIFNSGWYANLKMMWHKGYYYGSATNLPYPPSINVNHFSLKKHQWYQLVFQWNHAKKSYEMYMNGILVGKEPQYTHPQPFNYTTVADTLYTGNPMLSYAEAHFYNETFSPEEIRNMYKENATDFDEELDEELLKIHTGSHHNKFDFEINKEWELKLDIPFDKEDDLEKFYCQGYQIAPSITEEGMRLTTPLTYTTDGLSNLQVYMWTWDTFEGDIYIEFEFKPEREGGLSLLMWNATGMNREDFMKDYELRTSGKMRMVAWQDVRNYHWEFYRETYDARNDIASSAALKNPWKRPMGYSTDELLEKGKWHKLQLVQRGNHIIGAIDGKVYLEFEDDPTQNNGPVYSAGHVAIRAMIDTDVSYRHLKIYNRNQGFKILSEYPKN